MRHRLAATNGSAARSQTFTGRHAIVRAYHVIWGAYGFWLPNDPRGSWSAFVGAWELYRFGRATTTGSRRSVASAPHDRQRRLAAKRALPYPAVVFDGRQAAAIARGFAERAAKMDLSIHACSIMPEHVHLVIGRHVSKVERIATRLKAGATKALDATGLHPLEAYVRNDGRTPSPWGCGEWKVYLNTLRDIA